MLSAEASRRRASATAGSVDGSRGPGCDCARSRSYSADSSPARRAETRLSVSASSTTEVMVGAAGERRAGVRCCATRGIWTPPSAVSYTHLRAHETDSYLVCRLLLA